MSKDMQVGVLSLVPFSPASSVIEHYLGTIEAEVLITSPGTIARKA